MGSTGKLGLTIHQSVATLKLKGVQQAKGIWGATGSGTWHHWGEPIFGSYLSDDERVIRKHAPNDRFNYRAQFTTFE